MERKIIIGALSLFLSGCSSILPVKEVYIPIPTLVKINPEPRPKLLSATEEEGVTEEDRLKAAKMDILIRDKYVDDLLRLIEEHDKTVPKIPEGFILKKKGE